MGRRSATELVDELRQFTAERWVGEPPDVTRLRSFSLPPMGNLPCVLYCNFDLFWAGEQLQVCRQAALAGDLRLPELTEVSALLLDRIAARTAKWEMAETVALDPACGRGAPRVAAGHGRGVRGRDRASAHGDQPDPGRDRRDHPVERAGSRRAPTRHPGMTG